MRYDELTRAMVCFKADGLSGLKRKPIQQIWRDHMLVGAMLLDRAAHWEDGLYVFIYPEDNEPCSRTVQLYGDYLADQYTDVRGDDARAHRHGDWVGRRVDP